MPLVKQFVTSCCCCQTGLQCSSHSCQHNNNNNNNIITSSSLDNDFNVALVALIQQLARVIQCCDVLFGELITDIELLQQRTNKLHNNVRALNNTIQGLEAATVVVPEGSVSDSCAGRRLVRRSSVTDYTSRLQLRLFTRLSRPQSIVLLYDACQSTPINIIKQCDSYREDGQLGTHIFSVPIICLHQHIVDNVLNVGCVQSGRWRQALGRSVKTLRPSNRTQQQQQQQQQQQRDDVNEPDDYQPSGVPSTFPSQHQYYTLPSGLSGARSCFTLHTVPVDVSGLSFKLHQSNSSGARHNDDDVATSLSSNSTDLTYCKLATWRRTVADISQLHDVTDNKLRPQYMSTLQVSRDSNVGGVKSHGLAGRYCKWRQSVKSVFKAMTGSLLRSNKSRVELWTADGQNTPQTDRHITIATRGPSSHNMSNVTFRRAYSLPRTLRATRKDLENTSRSVEGHLDMTDGRARSRPQSEHVHLTVPPGKDISAPPTETDQQLAPFVDTDQSTSTREDIVLVNIPEQPWTQPFAHVKLRTKATHTVAKYRSSSGHWSCASIVALHQPTTTTRNSGIVDITDSAVSLNSNSPTDFRLTSEDCLTLKQSLSTVTLNNNNNNNNNTVSVHCCALQQVPSNQVSLTTFARNTDAGNVRSTHIPLPPTRVCSMTSQLLDTVNSDGTAATSGTCGTTGTPSTSELEKLASLANKFVEHATASKIFPRLASTNCTSTSCTSTSVSSVQCHTESRDVTDDVIACDDSTTRQSPVLPDSINAHLTCSNLSPAVSPLMPPRVISPVTSAGPQPVSARLIISSPVASRAQFIDNPHKRSVCQPLRVAQDTSGLANSAVILACDGDRPAASQSELAPASTHTVCAVTSLQCDVSSSSSKTRQQTVERSATLRNKVYVNLQQTREQSIVPQHTDTGCVFAADTTTGSTCSTTGTTLTTGGTSPSTHSLPRGHARVKYSPLTLGVQRLATQTDLESSQGKGITGTRTTVKLLKHKDNKTRRQVDKLSTVDDTAITRSQAPTNVNNSLTTFTCNSLGRHTTLHSMSDVNRPTGPYVCRTLPLNVKADCSQYVLVSK